MFSFQFRRMSGGQILIQTLVLAALAVVFITVLVNVAISQIGFVSRALHSEQAFQIAEAGIEYYRWHLAHAPQDFTNGTGQQGPYTINYTDTAGIVIGRFMLTIDTPPIGSTIVTIKSTGTLTADSSVSRTIMVKLGVPSVAKYAVVANDDMRFGVGTEVFGPLHSNGGIHFDGLAHNVISSAKASYDDLDHSGANEFGVHTHIAPVDPFPPASVPNRQDVFMAGRQFPVPAVDFTGFTANLAQIKASAQSGGKYFSSSGAQGYEIVLRTNGTFDIYKVNSLKAAPSGCTDTLGENGWGTWSVNATSTVGNYPLPGNGLIFVEDHVWVSGKINGARVTIASGRFPQNPNTDTSITVNGNLMYTNYDGSDVIGLFAQNNVNIGLFSSDVFRIDAALIAENGRAGRYYYRAPSGQQYCGVNALRNTVTLYGMIASNLRYGFSWSCGGVYCSGYQYRNLIYDRNLLFGPPPSFPVTSDQYQTISWQEVR